MKYIIPHKIYGIWGYGLTGSSYARLLLSHQVSSIHVYNKTSLKAEDKAWLLTNNVILHNPHELNTFLNNVEILLPSPGVDISTHAASYTTIPEFNIFREMWKGLLITVTGTVGKTTVTTLLGHALSSNHESVIGGNIGTPMLDLLSGERNVPAIIELSSFQLEYVTTASDISIITNIYPNHLDRHRSMEAYLNAKINSIRYQTNSQRALVPLTLFAELQKVGHGKKAWFSTAPSTIYENIGEDPLYFIENNFIICKTLDNRRTIGVIPEISSSFRENWLIVAAALDLLGASIKEIPWHTLDLPPHRCRYLGTWKTISFYDDSKATVPEATLAALHAFSQKKLVLFVGGTSKGINRKLFCSQLPRAVRYVVAFGSEAKQLSEWCIEQGIPTSYHATLEEAFTYYIHNHSQEHDHVLFSPGGASFDLFEHYQARGICFQKLVFSWAEALTTFLKP